ncbi:MAG: ribonuclease HII [Candidatus Pacebacteria bacterium]|nr:ribonuclease HII [Candidatus Paceibacterota bacterium]
MRKWLVGIDEAGRGPLAGPVSVGVVVAPSAFKTAFKKYAVKDSKKLSEKDREQWYKWLNKERREGKLNFATALVSNQIIDKQGIVPAVRLGIKRCLTRLNLEPEECEVLLDGSLKAPLIFKQQKTIIKGDETEPIIALASIAAKVRRDRYMCRLAPKYPKYNFEIHKGYGTKAHYAALKKHGLSTIHRLSFLTKGVK